MPAMTGNKDDPQFISEALDQLQNLLFLLFHPRYGFLKEEKTEGFWKQEVKDPSLRKHSHDQLLALLMLKEVMVMHRKEDLKLPRPIFLQVECEVMIPLDEEIRTNLSQKGTRKF
jgi:hypothetical protein